MLSCPVQEFVSLAVLLSNQSQGCYRLLQLRAHPLSMANARMQHLLNIWKRHALSGSSSMMAMLSWLYFTGPAGKVGPPCVAYHCIALDFVTKASTRAISKLLKPLLQSKSSRSIPSHSLYAFILAWPISNTILYCLTHLKRYEPQRPVWRQRRPWCEFCLLKMKRQAA